MANQTIQDIRNIALVGHGSAGKTTLADKFLTFTGTLNANPSVDDGTSICESLKFVEITNPGALRLLLVVEKRRHHRPPVAKAGPDLSRLRAHYM